MTANQKFVLCLIALVVLGITGEQYAKSLKFHNCTIVLGSGWNE